MKSQRKTLESPVSKTFLYLRDSLERRHQEMKAAPPQDALEGWVERLQTIRPYENIRACAGITRSN